MLGILDHKVMSPILKVFHMQNPELDNYTTEAQRRC